MFENIFSLVLKEHTNNSTSGVANDLAGVWMEYEDVWKHIFISLKGAHKQFRSDVQNNQTLHTKH